MFDGPDGARSRLNGNALDVAVSQAPDFRQGSGAANEGIVLRDCAVGVDADGLAHVGAQILRLGPHRLVRAFAQCDEQLAIRREGQGRPEMLVAVIDGQGAEDDLDVLDACSIVRQTAARDRGSVAALAGSGIAPIDHAILRKARSDDHIQQAALTARIDGRQARDRFADLALGGDDAQTARLFSHQPAAVRQGRQTPGVDKARGDHRVGHGLFGLDPRRAGLAGESRLLIGIVRRTGFQRGPSLRRGAGALAICATGGGENEQGCRGGGDDQAHEGRAPAGLWAVVTKRRGQRYRSCSKASCALSPQVLVRDDLNRAPDGDIGTPLSRWPRPRAGPGTG